MPYLAHLRYVRLPIVFMFANGPFKSVRELLAKFCGNLDLRPG